MKKTSLSLTALFVAGVLTLAGGISIASAQNADTTATPQANADQTQTYSPNGPGPMWNQGQGMQGQMYAQNGPGPMWNQNGQGQMWGPNGQGQMWGPNGQGQNWGQNGQGQNWGQNGQGQMWGGQHHMHDHDGQWGGQGPQGYGYGYGMGQGQQGQGFGMGQGQQGQGFGMGQGQQGQGFGMGQGQQGQVQNFGQGMNGGRMGGFATGRFAVLACSDQGSERIGMMLTHMEESLNLTDDQKALFDTFFTAATDAQATYLDACQTVDDLKAADNTTETSAPTPVDLLTLRATNLKAEASALESVIPSATAFFDSLTADQLAQLAPQPRMANR
ncbi:MAG: Spy/CpxP family protein refolding chaperone [Hyphomicrobiaceae bacterium]|nr:Spy/CpxP family protein refolding chaperone [Hyphomicrobiaceae bacterium]